jgi:DNA-binding YbaB/EbfC family protein
MDLNALMKQAQQMQEKLQAAQQRLAESTVDGTSGGGMVRVTLTGAGEMKGVVLDESLLQPGEAEIVSDLVVAAHADAKKKLDEMQARLMQEAAGPLAGMGGMGMGGGMPGFPKF